MENISVTTEFTTNYAEIFTLNYTEYGNITDKVNYTETSDVIVARLDDVTTIIASLWITIAVIGFLGNALLFVMTHNQSIRDQSYALFLCVLSVVDSIVLFVRLAHGSALLASTQAKPQGPLVGILDTNVACVLTGLELSARCLSAWILGKKMIFQLMINDPVIITLAQTTQRQQDDVSRCICIASLSCFGEQWIAPNLEIN